jgi:triacylglycerol lipase
VDRVFRVPGFFGFANLGDFPYWRGFDERLQARLSARGRDVSVSPLTTLATRSIRERASFLRDRILEDSEASDRVHLIGHSTGGLDARFLVSAPAPHFRAVADRVRTVVTMASPHRGAPIMSFFTGIAGRSLLQLLSLSTIRALRLGSIPFPALTLLGGALAGGTVAPGFSRGVTHQVYQLILRDFSPARRREIEAFFEQAYQDQTLMLQLTPEAMDLFHSLAVPPASVRIGCVVTMAPAPDLRRQRSLGPNPTLQAGYGLYRALHRSSRFEAGEVDIHLRDDQREALVAAYGEVPALEANDAMVPTLGQVWGEVVHAAVADHLDVTGHFHGNDGHHVDWIRTASHFDREAFAAMVEDVARFIG